jgi:uncharacterized protein
MRASILRPLLWFGLLCSAQVPAQDGSLYEGETTVPDQSAEARAAALPRALRQVLVKVTGDAGAGSDPALAGAFADATSLMQQYRYRQDVVTSSGAPQLRLSLIARFDPAAVDALLASSGRDLWPSPRPKPLLWLAIDDGSGPRLVGQAQAAAVATLSRRAAERGLTMSFPKADLADQTVGGPQAVWRSDLESVRTAATRYGREPVLIGRMQRGAGGWTVDWILIEGSSELRRWSTTDAEAGVVLAAGADGAATALAKYYASRILGGPAGDYPIVIEGLASAGDYARALQYLQGLPIVQAVQVEQAGENQVQLLLSLRSGIEGLTRLAASGGVLTRIEDAAPGPSRFRLER